MCPSLLLHDGEINRCLVDHSRRFSFACLLGSLSSPFRVRACGGLQNISPRFNVLVEMALNNIIELTLLLHIA